MSLSKKIIILIFLLCLIVFALIFSLKNSQKPLNNQRNSAELGLQQVECWLPLKEGWPRLDCYRMYVPEDHEKANSRIIHFPVMVFHTESAKPHRAPVLHLGGGGPGGGMYLDNAYSVQSIINDHDDISLKQGRDLVVIDPRGAGLSEPLLNCGRFVDSEIERLQKDLSLKEELFLQDQDYVGCIQDSAKRNIDLTAYNSISVIQDMELLRKALDKQQWVLIGVSYGAVYAQLLANKYPDVVQSMVLDSAAFPDLKLQHEFLARLLSPYEALYDYCDRSLFCREGMPNVKERLWNIVEKLDKKPHQIPLVYQDQGEEKSLELVLNGHRFIAILAYAVYYGEKIYEDLPDIITTLEEDKPRIDFSFNRYATNYVDFMVDRGFADLSMFSHYCYDDKSFVDIDYIKQQLQNLPNQLLRDAAAYLVDNHESCELLAERTVDPLVNSVLKTDIPTLFLQGELDIVTPPKDAQSHLANFTQGHLVMVEYSHSVLQVAPCAELMAAKFVNDPSISGASLTCER
ncbi:MAG: Unknown protein [uncultured Thiotrichaceae bacterium]|uniref:Proline iminopeptidase n=1 Tax=uncultured Thiotrichaceae bacterium TaxID=298394 RepID=A0A6S6U2I2_9GAMM|nr:MAG: Unknown protein [uncultured Thiotrichaceae bacterium]